MSFAIPDTELRRYLIAGVYHDRRYLAYFADHLKADYFLTPEEGWLVTTAVDHWRAHQDAPGPEILAFELTRAARAGEDPNLITGITAYFDRLPDLTEPHTRHLRDYVFVHAGEFLRQQALVQAVEAAAVDIRQGRLDRIERDVARALQVGKEWDTTFYRLFADAAAWLADYATSTPVLARTGLAPLDRDMSGGLRAGELGVWMANTNKGKSHALIWSAVQAARDGHHALHVSLEMSNRSVLGRYVANVTGLPAYAVWDTPLDTQEALGRARATHAIGGEVTAGAYAPGGLSVSGLRVLLDRFAAQDRPVDVLVVDYADLVAPSRREEKRYLEQGVVYEDLRALGVDYGIPVWTATQANRGGERKEELSLDDIADSYEKAKIADAIITMSQTRAQEAAPGGPLMLLALAKSRNGIARRSVEVRVDWTCSRIALTAPDPDAARADVGPTAADVAYLDLGVTA